MNSFKSFFFDFYINSLEFYQAAVEAFHELDSRINNVATKVVYLGDQLENVNTPRARAVEAQKLLSHFNGFIKPGVPLSPVFNDKDQVSHYNFKILNWNVLTLL